MIIFKRRPRPQPQTEPQADIAPCPALNDNVRNLYIRDDDIIFVETSKTRRNMAPGDLIAIHRPSYSLTGTYVGETKSGILLEDWSIKKNV